MYYDDDVKQPTATDRRPEHYYGDYVRRLFLGGGALMIFGYPFFRDVINVPVWIAILSILLIGIFSGMQNPRHRWTALLNTAVSVIAFCVFIYKGAGFYLAGRYDEAPVFFWVNQLLALIFFFAMYYSVKSTRAPLASRA